MKTIKIIIGDFNTFLSKLGVSRTKPSDFAHISSSVQNVFILTHHREIDAHLLNFILESYFP